MTLSQRADVLGRLLVVQETLDVMPDEAGIAAFLRRALGEVPGVADVHLCVRGVLYPPTDALKHACARYASAWDAPASVGPADCPAPPGVVLLRLASSEHLYGFLALSIDDPVEFAAYETFLRNTANIVANLLERRHHLAEITSANEELARMKGELEVRVAQRTAELSERNAELIEEAAQRKRTQDALVESEEKFRALSTAAQDAMITLDDAGRIVFWNEAAARIFGYAPEEALGQHAHELLAPARYLEAGKAGWPRFASHGEGPVVGTVRELDALRRDGAEFPIELSVAAAKLRGRWHAIGIARDITERKHEEQALRRSEARLALQFERMPIGCITWTTDFRVAAWNPAAEKIFGFTASEAMGKHPYDFIVPKEAQPHVDAIWARLLQGDETAHSVNDNLTRDGRTITCDWTNTPLREADGAVVGALAMVQDITERVRAEQELRRASLYARSLIEASLDPLVTISAEGKITDVNDATVNVTGVERGRLVGSDFSEYFTEPERARAGYREVFTKGFVRDYPLAIHDVSGKITEVLYNASVYRDEKGDVCGVFAAARDITERKRAENELRESEARHRTVLNALWEGVVLQGADGVIQGANPSAERILGLTHDQMMERTSLDTQWRSIHEDGSPFPGEEHPAMVTLRTGRPLNGVIMGIHKPDGSVAWISINSEPIFRPDETRPSAVVTSFSDVTTLKRTERLLQTTNRALKTLSSGNEVLVRATEESVLLQEMCRVIVDVGGYRLAWIGFADPADVRTVRPAAWAGFEDGFLERGRIIAARTQTPGPAAAAISAGAVQIVQDIASNPRSAPWREEAVKRGYASLIALPLSDASGAFGVLVIYATTPDAFSEEEERLLTELSKDLSYGITSLRARVERGEAVQRLQKGLEATIQALASTVEARDPYTAGHQRGVARLASAIAREVGLPETQIHGVYLAGVIHDIGKIVVPAEILSKPGKLSPLEFNLIKVHAQAGYDIAKGVDFPWPIAQMVLQHHERLDGSGYPNGLKGEAILVEARILAVADVVEAMTSHRPYRAALGLEAALAEIEKGRGALFDAAAVDACVKLFRLGGFSFDGDARTIG